MNDGIESVRAGQIQTPQLVFNTTSILFRKLKINIRQRHHAPITPPNPPPHLESVSDGVHRRNVLDFPPSTSHFEYEVIY